MLVDGRGYSKSDRIQTAQLVESVTVRTTEGEHSNEDTDSMSEFNTLELIKPVPIGRRGYSKSEIRSSTTTTEVIPVQCSPPRPKHSFRDHIRSGLLDSTNILLNIYCMHICVIDFRVIIMFGLGRDENYFNAKYCFPNISDF